MWDLVPTRDQTWASCIRSRESQPLDHQGSPFLELWISYPLYSLSIPPIQMTHSTWWFKTTHIYDLAVFVHESLGMLPWVVLIQGTPWVVVTKLAWGRCHLKVWLKTQREGLLLTSFVWLFAKGFSSPLESLHRLLEVSSKAGFPQGNRVQERARQDHIFLWMNLRSHTPSFLPHSVG